MLTSGSSRRGEADALILLNRDMEDPIMSSIKHEILTKSPGFRAGAHGPSRNTIEQYKTHAIKYGQWAKKEFRCRRFEELRDHIQDYADYLKKR